MGETQYRSPGLEKFRVGDFFRSVSGVQRYGWVTGLGVNSTSEVVLRVRWADCPEDEHLLHPANAALIE